MSKPKLKVVGEALQSALLYTPWKTTYDVPKGNGRVAETELMDPPIRMLRYTMHGDCADLLPDITKKA